MSLAAAIQGLKHKNVAAAPSARIPAIDGLRATAMMMVIAFHCGLLPAGWTGVWLFYAISGFVISRNFLTERAAGARSLPHYASFLVRRFFRIVPPYFAYIAVCCAIAFALEPDKRFFELPYLLSFTENWFKIFHLKLAAEHSLSTVGHLWTISVEEQFYVFFPLIFFLTNDRRFLWATIILIALGPVFRWILSQIFIAQGMPDDQVAFGVYYSSVGQFDAFLSGVMLAIFESALRSRPRISRRLFFIALDAAALFVATYMVINVYAWHAHGARTFDRLVTGLLYGQGRELFLYSVLDLLAASVVALAIADHPWTRFLSSKPLVAAGRISYGGYLYHQLATIAVSHKIFRADLMVAAPLSVRLSAFALVTAGALACAWVSYAVLESRTLAIGHALSDKILRRGRSATTPNGVVEIEEKSRTEISHRSAHRREGGL